MANRSLEQMMAEEQKRLTRAASARGSKPAGLLDLVRPPAKASTTIPPGSASPMATFSKTAQTLAAAPINKGHTASTTAPQTSPAVPASAGGGTADAGKTALKVFTSGLGLMPLISGLAGLFGGGEPAAPVPLVKYAMPRSIQVTAANSRDGGGLQFADYGQDGSARSYSGAPAGTNGQPQTLTAAGQSQSGGPATQVVVNVQAMDSRSFLDHSQEIAQAVRDAMLNMHALNDVVSEL
jgi:hypothetical protein